MFMVMITQTNIQTMLVCDDKVHDKSNVFKALSLEQPLVQKS